MINNKVAVVMGSDSDFSIVKETIETLRFFEIETVVRIISAHRTPQIASSFAANAISENIKVIIAAASMAAHLAGAIAANTILPVIGLPIATSLNGLDSLLSTVQMPSGVPVATVGLNAAKNAAILAAQILSINNTELSVKLKQFKQKLEQATEEKNAAIHRKL